MTSQPPQHSLTVDKRVRVTFDSNVWRPVVTPHKFPNHPDRAVYQKIIVSIKNGWIEPFLSETTFTLESILNNDRKALLSSYEPEIQLSEQESDDGRVGISLSIGPDPSRYAQNNPYLIAHWHDAQLMGFKVLRCPRISGIKNVDIKEEDFALDDRIDSGKRQEEFGRCLTAIESAGCGMKHIRDLGSRYALGKPWIEGIKSAPESEAPAITKAVAEWADGDAIAAHYAYRNDYFCTNDTAKKAGANSVLSTGNRIWLSQHFKINFVTPSQLAALL